MPGGSIVLKAGHGFSPASRDPGCHTPPLGPVQRTQLLAWKESLPLPFHNQACYFALTTPGQLLPSPHTLLLCGSCFFDLLGENPWKPTLTSESEVAQSCPTLCDPMDCSLPGSSVHRTFQARVLEWVAFSFSRRSSRPRDRTQVSRIVGRRFTI